MDSSPEGCPSKSQGSLGLNLNFDDDDVHDIITIAIHFDFNGCDCDE